MSTKPAVVTTNDPDALYVHTSNTVPPSWTVPWYDPAAVLITAFPTPPAFTQLDPLYTRTAFVSFK